MRHKKFNGIMGDLPDFVSPIDGTVVHGRAGLREHMKRHNVTGASDYKEEWAKKAREREAFLTGQRVDSDRPHQLSEAIEKHRRK